MNKIVKGLVIFLFSSSTILAQESNCSRICNFGEAEICLPFIKGYQECYPDSIVKILADATEVPVNRVLGFYLNNQTYEKKDSLGLISFDDYFKVYGTKEIQNTKANLAVLAEMEKLISENFFSKNWDTMRKEIDKTGLDIEVGVPTIIEKYKLNDHSFSLLMITKYEYEGIEPFTLAMSLNGILVNERLIWMAYYLNFEGEESILRLKENSNKILTDFFVAGPIRD